MKPWLSFCIPVLNERGKIEKLLQQFKEQTDQNYELVVVDGGSTDGTKEMLKKYQKNVRQLKLFDEEGEIKSTGNARTQAIRHAKGEYILVVDSDVRIEKDTVERINKIIKENVGYDIITFRCLITPPKDATIFFYRDNAIEGGKILVRRKIHPGFHANCSFREDVLFYERIDISKYKVLNSAEKVPLYHYGVKNLNEFIRRYLWYGRTSIDYFFTTKKMKNKLEMIVAWILIPLVPLGIALGILKGLRLVWEYIKHKKQVNIILFISFVLLELVTVFAFSAGFWSRVLTGTKKKSRD